jgi:hypothetical protein
VVDRDPWSGIDLAVALSPEGIDDELIAAPGARLDEVGFDFPGVKAVEALTDGSVCFESTTGSIRYEEAEDGHRGHITTLDILARVARGGGADRLRVERIRHSHHSSPLSSAPMRIPHLRITMTTTDHSSGSTSRSPQP